MNRSSRWLQAILAVACAFAPFALQAAQPNILFIFADDQAIDTIRAFGNDEVDTPNLDRLVRQGTTFTHAYNQGAWHGAVCVASRTMLVTGRFLWHAHAEEGTLGEAYLAKGRLWPQLLADAGYRTYFTGKWHVKADATQAFQFTRHIRPGMPRTVGASYDRPVPGQPDAWSPYDESIGGFWQGGRHWSAVVADDAGDFLVESAQADSPFFIYAAFNAPHDPRQAPRKNVEQYPPDRVSVPSNFLPEYPYNEAMRSGRKLRDERLAPFPRTEYAVKVHRGEYYAAVTYLDEQVGRILAKLEETQQADNTVIFFTADHGLAVGHHGLFGKQNMFDHSVRVPLIVVGPGIPAGASIATPVYLQDIMPTTLELAGRAVPEHVEFHSLLPIIRRQSDGAYNAIYGAYVQDGQRMITAGPWKLILYPRAKKTLLFNLEDDPQEMRNLADEPAQADTVRRLFARLRELQKETGDTLDLAESFPQL